MNDLPCTTDLLIFLFADDTTSLASCQNLPRLIQLINTVLQNLANWFRDNSSKQSNIIFHTKGKKLSFDDEQVIFNSSEIGTQPDPTLSTNLNMSTKKS